MNKLLLIVGILIVLITTSSSNDKKHNDSFEPRDSANYLVEYGRYIFAREKCLTCHTLNIQNADSLKSLDGIGGRYPNALLYTRITLHDIYCTSVFLPDFDQLSQKEVIKKDFIQLYPDDNYSSINDKWQNFQHNVTKASDKAKDDRLYSHSSEISALIAYLQTIPSTAIKKAIDSMDRLAINTTKQSYINMFEDPENEIYSSYKSLDSASIKRGQEVFNTKCIACHGDRGKGLIGPNLTDKVWIYGDKPKEILSAIAFGTPNGMRAFFLEMTAKDMGNLLAYIQSIENKN